MIKLLFGKQTVIENFALLVLRFFMGATFIIYAAKKIAAFDNYVVLFSDKLDIPFPLLNLYLVIGIEGIGGLLLILGLLTRVAIIPLIITMITAFFLVNLGNGYAASNFGIEVPLAYISIMILLFSFGPGKYSIDKKFSSTCNKA